MAKNESLNNFEEKKYRYCPTCKATLVRKAIDRRKLLHCRECGFIFWNNPKPCVSMIVHKDDKILLLKRAKEPMKGNWELPGGFVDYGESPEEAIIRELKEETALDCKIKGFVGFFNTNEDPQGVHLDIVFHGDALNGQIKINKECDTYGYFKIEQFPQNIVTEHKESLKQYCKDL